MNRPNVNVRWMALIRVGAVALVSFNVGADDWRGVMGTASLWLTVEFAFWTDMWVARRRREQDALRGRARRTKGILW